MSESRMSFAVRHAMAAIAPLVVRHGGPLAFPAIMAGVGMLLVEQHRATLRQNPQALQDDLRTLQGALEDGVTGAVEGLAPERLP